MSFEDAERADTPSLAVREHSVFMRLSAILNTSLCKLHKSFCTALFLSRHTYNMLKKSGLCHCIAKKIKEIPLLYRPVAGFLTYTEESALLCINSLFLLLFLSPFSSSDILPQPSHPLLRRYHNT